MYQELTAITITTASIGLFHTLLGPDHYLPFIVLSKARKWSLIKTSWITFLCGIGHVLSSIVLGVVGIGVGISIKKLEIFESVRGDLAAWILICFGLIYFVWGLRSAFRKQPHKHWHAHGDMSMSIHKHPHNTDQLHVHKGNVKKNLTPWILFVIFVFGPCEPLIPLLMYPTVKSNIFGLVLVAGVFSLVTIVTMLGVVIFLFFGADLLPLSKLERYAHAFAGATICLCGLSIQFLGL
ncbi:MAG: hypothetical protein D8M57_03475 [Candidatus Scalindua sp. AMX11]|nr:MAG: hypothetical protein DWQ00_11215 [Candidatus Scalindua sp.]NOG82775.1 hypothetical protein [Planctomycetota bacterium]RZV95341.1 MAG: hypothetical protein EX341_03150 [Candidatus Scalindua sp. SCAELEC01]TDE66176.1 MAG: hypothetical protein D8M57_03475 [Candidatus Scalindua sp. AMX11]GJQ57794.1 MAG: hypothetical protein SCALA701_05950 [Candidatus Scalindua sp.]